jgi:hypothetical protein
LKLDELTIPTRKVPQKKRGRKPPKIACMLLKIKGEEIVIFGLSTMLMKVKALPAAFHDLDEKRWG